MYCILPFCAVLLLCIPFDQTKALNKKTGLFVEFFQQAMLAKQGASAALVVLGEGLVYAHFVHLLCEARLYGLGGIIEQYGKYDNAKRACFIIVLWSLGHRQYPFFECACPKMLGGKGKSRAFEFE